MSHPIRSSSISKKSPMPYRGMPVPPPRRDTPTPPQWPSYTGNSQFVGTSPNGKVNVYVDPTLGQPAMTNAQDLVNDADRVVTANDAIFGTPGGPVSVIVFALWDRTDGTGGADHMACDYVNGAAIEVCASFGDSARVSALFEAELSECSMGGNLCGVSTGEALSRWCAMVISNNALSDFATGPQWYQDGMPDYVDQTDPTDQDADSTGNGMVFISWLMSQGYSLGTIAQTMVSFEEAGTLAQVAPWTVEMAGKVFATILTDIAAGKAPHQIVASVRAAMVTAPKAKVSIGAPAVCSTKSHQLGCTGQGDASASARQ